MREHRFLVEPGDLRETDAIIRGGELRHLRKVLRLRAGDPVVVFDGEGRGFRGSLERVEDDRAVVILGQAEPAEVEPVPAISLFQAILHTERMESIVEKSTELGVREFTPVISRRSVVRPGRKGWGRLDRLRKIAVAAAKQSGRLRVPGIREPASFEEVVAGSAAPAGAPLRILCHGGSPPLAGVLKGAPPGPVGLLVGPEGGWTGEEIARALECGWLEAGLGPTTLRADTAAVLAVGLLLALSGEAPEP